MQYHISKELSIEKRNIVLYALCVLYLLSSATISLDIASQLSQVTGKSVSEICVHHNNVSLYTIVYRGSFNSTVIMWQ